MDIKARLITRKAHYISRLFDCVLYAYMPIRQAGVKVYPRHPEFISGSHPFIIEI